MGFKITDEPDNFEETGTEVYKTKGEFAAKRREYLEGFKSKAHKFIDDCDRGFVLISVKREHGDVTVKQLVAQAGGTHDIVDMLKGILATASELVEKTEAILKQEAPNELKHFRWHVDNLGHDDDDDKEEDDKE